MGQTGVVEGIVSGVCHTFLGFGSGANRAGFLFCTILVNECLGFNFPLAEKMPRGRNFLGVGITAGTSEGIFEPEASCTRGQVVTFLWRAKGQPEPNTTVCPFTDVHTWDYFYKAVLWAYENGITAGVSATEFGPETTVDRGQVVTFMWRDAGMPGASVSNPFVDVANGIYYHDAVLWAYQNGVTSGINATEFGPANPCTRGQVVTFLYRAIGK